MRALESEVRDLKNLLDEKDEKIDVLSRIHSFSPSSRQRPSVAAPSPSAPARSNAPDVDEGVIQIPPSLPPTESTSAESTGISSTRGFVGMFNRSFLHS